ncbi:GNAT family N-acetyltransferase [Flavobacterium sp. HBTb2-11-1]|uniref:GNAT family N-acetyltransferase n=1 Tax=Flavobacterium sp. HBTb2-11-1 TaxID=2692212 RepID=UPI00136D6A6A|nr:GNAT family N-acetyltransferase [Flavobacterium sp. HBTb2-11-1]MXO04008.1 GNAT family N-acetyltransferase [Flavobacterium sp. HBTb2-11-1]
MIIEKINNVKSEEFKRAVELGDRNSATLGFLPYQAFEKYASNNQLIGVFEDDSRDLMGYLLYRISFNRVTIVHCCVDENHRKKNIAFTLVEYLKNNTRQFEGIKLSCRNDYGIDKVWEGFNFVPIKEKRGRSKLGLPLTVWWYPQYQNNLLSQISDYEISNKIVAVIDMNVFLDIKDKREDESLALNSDWLLAEAILFVTREINIEINRSKTQKQKETSRQLLSHYNELPFKDEESYKKVLEELKIIFPLKSQNDKSDLNHIAYSITGGAHFFITRDQEILNKAEYFNDNYNIIICRPSDFITHLDENIQVTKYQPQRLIGTNINSKSITASNISHFTEVFLKPAEKKHQFDKIVRNCLSSPNDFELVTISKEDDLLAFIVFDRSSEDKLNIPVFRFLKNELKITLAKHLLFKTILTSTKEDRVLIEINEQNLDDDLIDCIKEARFVKVMNSWQKINLKGVVEEKRLVQDISNKNNELSNIENTLKEVIKEVENKEGSYNFIEGYSFERYLSPVKIEELEIPTYIVAIQPQWAEQLFDDRSEEKLALFEPQYELLLNRENVYYRSANPKILKSPARILWYISENKTTKCKGRITASSYIDEIFIDDPKKLFKQFKQLGIYEWKHVAETAKKSNEVMAFVFSDTEIFKNSIPLNQIKELIKKLENKNFMALSPVEIKTETYLALYKLGMEL